MIMHGFYGNTLSSERGGQTVLVKTHSYKSHCNFLTLITNFNSSNLIRYFFVLVIQSVVVLLRNPFESIISYRKLETVGKIENPDEVTAFNVTKWTDFKKKEIGSWFRLAMSYLNMPSSKMHFINYDELVGNTKRGKLKFRL